MKQTIFYQGDAIGEVTGVQTETEGEAWLFTGKMKLGGITFTFIVGADNFITAARRGAALFHEFIGSKIPDGFDGELFDWEGRGSDSESYRVREVAE